MPNPLHSIPSTQAALPCQAFCPGGLQGVLLTVLWGFLTVRVHLLRGFVQFAAGFLLSSAGCICCGVHLLRGFLSGIGCIPCAHFLSKSLAIRHPQGGGLQSERRAQIGMFFAE